MNFQSSLAQQPGLLCLHPMIALLQLQIRSISYFSSQVSFPQAEQIYSLDHTQGLGVVEHLHILKLLEWI